LNPVIVFALGIMMRKVTRLAREKGARFEYLFVRPDGEQLGAIAALLEQGTIRPVIDRTFPFLETKEAMAYVEAGRAVGKVVIVRDAP
jgi:NADPH:quinone reductase-like Zn-dependent oxidoreductase